MRIRLCDQIVEWRVNGVVSAIGVEVFLSDPNKIYQPYIEMLDKGDKVRWIGGRY